MDTGWPRAIAFTGISLESAEPAYRDCHSRESGKTRPKAEVLRDGHPLGVGRKASLQIPTLVLRARVEELN